MLKIPPYSFYQYLVTKVRPDLYIFAEENQPLNDEWGKSFYVNSMQLVIGEKRAALIDTGYGFGDLMPLIRRYTDLPVTLLITHGDYDHWRGANQFEDIYLSKIDDDRITQQKKQMGRPFAAKDIRDGDSFDLGGVVLEAIGVPGHSPGSMCFLDRKNNAIFTGDAVNKLPWIFSGRGTLEEYCAALTRLRDMTPEKPIICCGHATEPFPYQVLEDSVTACREVLAGGTEDPAYFNPLSPSREPFENTFVHQVGEVRLCYSPTYLR